MTVPCSQRVFFKGFTESRRPLPVNINHLTNRTPETFNIFASPFFPWSPSQNVMFAVTRVFSEVKLLMLYFQFLKNFLIKLRFFSPWGTTNGQLSSLVLLLPLPSQQNASETVIIQWWNTKCRNAISLNVNWDFVMPF